MRPTAGLESDGLHPQDAARFFTAGCASAGACRMRGCATERVATGRQGRAMAWPKRRIGNAPTGATGSGRECEPGRPETTHPGRTGVRLIA